MFMKALRVKLRQTSANYRREETMENKMTYPLPPISTVIGALHAACGYTEYNEMKVSIQGKFTSMHKEPYVDECFLNSTMDDRGILVKMKNETMLSNAFVKVASAKKSQGNSFLKGITIQIHDKELLREYQSLRELGSRLQDWKNTEYKQKLQEFKQKINKLSAKKKQIGKGNSGYDEIVRKEKSVRTEEELYKKKVVQYEEENYKRPIAKFRTLTKSLKYYEILDEVELILHVHAGDEILKDIYENIYNLKALGRSEDFVDLTEIKQVELIQQKKCIDSPYSAYLNFEDVRNSCIYSGEMIGRDFCGTVYYFGKKYEIVNGKRIFPDKTKVLYTSCYGIDETSSNVWADVYYEDEEEKAYIVNFL